MDRWPASENSSALPGGLAMVVVSARSTTSRLWIGRRPQPSQKETLTAFLGITKLCRWSAVLLVGPPDR